MIKVTRLLELTRIYSSEKKLHTISIWQWFSMFPIIQLLWKQITRSKEYFARNCPSIQTSTRWSLWYHPLEYSFSIPGQCNLQSVHDRRRIFYCKKKANICWKLQSRIACINKTRNTAINNRCNSKEAIFIYRKTTSECFQ